MFMYLAQPLVKSSVQMGAVSVYHVGPILDSVGSSVHNHIVKSTLNGVKLKTIVVPSINL